MVKARMGVGLIAGCLLGLGGAAAQSAPTVPDLLKYSPRQPGIALSTPTPQELGACKVELVKMGKAGSGWMLRDPRGLPLRCFFDLDGNRTVDRWSYYLDGVEVYREASSRLDGKVDQYRWMNTGGTRFGLDLNADGKIDSWKIISPEEVSQEVLQAVITKDQARLQALYISEAEMKSLGLSTAEMNRIRQFLAKAPAKFQKAISQPGLDDKARWERLEAGVPQCVLAEQTGARQDIFKYQRATVLYENAGKHDYLTIGEIIQVGMSWRLIDAPGENEVVDDMKPELKKLLEDLNNLESASPKNKDSGSPDVATVRYYLQRADLIQKILPLDTKDGQREIWLRQLAECFGAASQSSPDTDRTAYEKLKQLEAQVAKEQPGSNIAAFITYREMQAENAVKLATAARSNQASAFPKIQAEWLERLGQFVQAYPKTDDTAEALFQAGMASEFINKEIEAKNWYGKLAREFPEHSTAAKAKGALARLDLEGKKLELAGPKSGGGSFDISALGGKLVVVYYWTSGNEQCIGDFARLKLLLSSYASKGLELVCVNLDNGPPEADNPMVKNPPPGIQVIQTNGLDSPLAVHYGIISLPNMFLVGKDGKVLSRTVQMVNLEDEIKKQLK